MKAKIYGLIILTASSFIGCFGGEGEGEGADYLSKGIWETQIKYLDYSDSVLSKNQIQVLDNGAIDWRQSIYKKDENGVYNRIFHFTRVQGTHKLDNDSLHMFGETFQDTCCEVMGFVDLESLPKRQTPVGWEKRSELIRNVSTTKFETLIDDGSDLYWSTFTKK